MDANFLILSFCAGVSAAIVFQVLRPFLSGEQPGKNLAPAWFKLALLSLFGVVAVPQLGVWAIVYTIALAIGEIAASRLMGLILKG